MKMYIMIWEHVPDKLAPVIAAHASLACYLKFQDDPRMKEWLEKSFKKVVCRVSESDFKWLKVVDKIDNLKHLSYNITTESALSGEEVAITFCPEKSFPEFFHNFQLWKPAVQSRAYISSHEHL
jgi:peptidyl-tRNA hydrolase